MARNCEPEIREHVTMRMRRRAEIQKRKAEASGSSSHVARAHYPNIQNVRSPVFKWSGILSYSYTEDLYHRPRSPRGFLLYQQRARSSGHQRDATVSTNHYVRAFYPHHHRNRNRGLRLLMDFGVLNISSCAPMNYSFVEIWHGKPP